MLFLRNTIVCLAALLVASSAPGAKLSPKSVNSSAPRVIESAYVCWGAPLSGGPVRALFVAPRGTLRDVDELKRRLDVEAEIVALWDRDHLGGPPEQGGDDAVTKRLYDALDGKWDVVVLAGFDLAVLPEPAQQALVYRIADGGGVMLSLCTRPETGPLAAMLHEAVAVDGFPAVQNGVGETGLADWDAGRKFVHTASFKAGRVLVMEYPDNPPVTHCLIQMPEDPLKRYAVQEDNLYSFAARAVRWAAGRTPNVLIAGIADARPAGPSDEEIPPDLPTAIKDSVGEPVLAQPSQPYTIALNRPADKTYTVSVQVRRVENPLYITYLFNDTLPAGAARYNFELMLGPGEYELDAWLRDGEKIVDWFTRTDDVNGWPEFTDLTFGAASLKPNDTLDIRATVSTIFGKQRQCILYARALDCFGYATTPGGRLLASTQEDVPEDGGAVALRLSLADAIAPVVKVEVYAIENATPPINEMQLAGAYREYRFFPVRLSTPPRAPYLAVEGCVPEEYNGGFVLDKLRDAGAAFVLGPAVDTALFHTARHGLDYLPELDHFSATAPEGAYERDPCLSDMAFRERETPILSNGTALFKAGGRRLYSLGHANCLCENGGWVCHAPACAQGFPQWLRRVYPDLDALNRAWGAPFSAWEDIAPPLPPDTAAAPVVVEAANAAGPSDQSDQSDRSDGARTVPGSGALASYVDFRRYMDGVFADFHAFAKELVHKEDSEGVAGAGFAAGDAATLGEDWPSLCKALDFVVSDGDPVRLTQAASFQAAGSFSGVRTAACGDAAARWLPWAAVLHGLPGVWCGPASGGAEAAMSPEGQPAPWFAALSGEMARLNDGGLGALLLAATPDAAAPAVFESEASRLLNECDPRFGISMHDEKARWLRLFMRAGCMPRFVTADDLAKAEKRPPLLALPLARALSDADVAAIRRYVEAGGWLIADVAPGVCDEHGVARATGALDDLFGAQRNGAPAKTVLEKMRVEVAAEGKTRKADLPTVTADASVPGAWLRTGPDGHALLLNHILPEQFSGAEDWCAALAAFARAAGCAPCIEAEVKKGAFQGELFRFSYGGAKIVAALADADAGEQKVRLKLDKKSKVYNPLTGELMSNPAKLNVTLPPGGACCFSALPYAIETISVLVPDSVLAGSRLVAKITVTAKKAKAGDHLATLDLVPNGLPPLRHYRRYVRCAGGQGETFIPLAQNEAMGVYTLRVRDALTGITVEKTVRIAPNPGAENSK